MATKQQLLDKRDDIIQKIRELKEDLKFVDAELKRLKISDDNKPQVVYNDYRSW